VSSPARAACPNRDNALSNSLSQSESICDAGHIPKLRIKLRLRSRRVQGKIHMRKTTLFAVAVGALVLVGVGTWFGVRTFTATGALAGSADNAPGMMTGAKGPPTSPHDDYDIVVH